MTANLLNRIKTLRHVSRGLSSRLSKDDLKMFRILLKNFRPPKEALQSITYHFRLSKRQCFTAHQTEIKNVGDCRNYAKRFIKLFELSQNNSPKSFSKHLNSILSWTKSFPQQYPKVDKRKTFENVHKDIINWLTGVLAVSSVIVGHKWMYKKEEQKCPLLSIDSKTFQRTFKNCIINDNLVLAVNSSGLLNDVKLKSKINSTFSDSKVPSTKLDNSVAVFHGVIKECNGSLLNKMALKFKNINQHKKAFALFKQASAFDDVASFYNLGICYELGQGVSQSYQKAFKYYELAAEKGHSKSMYNIATFFYEGILEDDDKNTNGFSHMLKAADHGVVQAQSFVARHYADKGKWSEAIRYFRLAAEQNDVSSIFNLATCFDTGVGVLKNNQKTTELYQRAAAKGHVLSQHRLGESYELGLRGLALNVETAMKWYKLASKQGHSPSTKRIELLEYVNAQRDKDIVFKTFESSPIFSILQPIQIYNKSIQKSTSMPSLPNLELHTRSLQISRGRTIHTSMQCLNEHNIDKCYACVDEGYNGSPNEDKHFRLDPILTKESGLW